MRVYLMLFMYYLLLMFKMTILVKWYKQLGFVKGDITSSSIQVLGKYFASVETQFNMHVISRSVGHGNLLLEKMSYISWW